MRWIAILLCTITTTCHGGEVSKFAQNAADFKYKSIAIGDSLRECEETLGEPTESDPFLNQAAYNVPGSDGRWTSIMLRDGHVWAITAVFSSEAVARIGGESVVKEKVVQLYGRPHGEKEGVFSWVFDDVGRLISYVAKEGSIAISVEEIPSQEEQLEESAEDESQPDAFTAVPEEPNHSAEDAAPSSTDSDDDQ